MDDTKYTDLDTYQLAAMDVAVYPSVGDNLIYPTLGLVSESGEVAGKLKKLYRDDGGVLGPERREQMVSELGDVLWYVAAIASELNVPLSVVASNNIQKLRARQTADTIRGDGDDR